MFNEEIPFVIGIETWSKAFEIENERNSFNFLTLLKVV